LSPAGPLRTLPEAPQLRPRGAVAALGPETAQPVAQVGLVVHRTERVLQLPERRERRQAAVRNGDAQGLHGVAPLLERDARRVELCIVVEVRSGVAHRQERPRSPVLHPGPRRLHEAGLGEPALPRPVERVPQASLELDDGRAGDGSGRLADEPATPPAQLPAQAIEPGVRRLIPHRRFQKSHLHLRLAGRAQPPAEATQSSPNPFEVPSPERRPPKRQGGLEAARGHAQVVHGLGVRRVLDATQAVPESLESLQEVGGDPGLRQIGGGRLRRRGVDLVRGHDHGSRSETGPFSDGPSLGRRRMSRTRVHSCSEMDSIESTPGSVSKRYSSERASSWAMTRSW